MNLNELLLRLQEFKVRYGGALYVDVMTETEDAQVQQLLGDLVVTEGRLILLSEEI